MRKLFTLLIILCTFSAYTQNVKPESNGTNTYTLIKKSKTKQNQEAKKTGEFVRVDGVLYPIYETKNKTYYILRKSKNGNVYRQKIIF